MGMTWQLKTIHSQLAPHPGIHHHHLLFQVVSITTWMNWSTHWAITLHSNAASSNTTSFFFFLLHVLAMMKTPPLIAMTKCQLTMPQSSSLAKGTVSWQNLMTNWPTAPIKNDLNWSKGWNRFYRTRICPWSSSSPQFQLCLQRGRPSTKRNKSAFELHEDEVKKKARVMKKL